MASAKCLVPVDTFRQKYQSDSAGGSRAVFILGSLASLPLEDVVSRRSISLSDEDKTILSKGLALPPDRWTDLDAIVARYAQDETVRLGPQEIFTTGMAISCQTILSKLRDFFRSSTDTDGGKFNTIPSYILAVGIMCVYYAAVIHYFGNGRRLRGDWCFSDGYITFQDLMDVYMETYRGRVLTIVCDCSHSGSWVKQGYEFMDGQGIIPCGHHAIQKGVLAKVFASCRPTDRANVLAYSLNCMFHDKNSGSNMHRVSQKIGQQQMSFGRDFTRMLCGNKVDEQCAQDSSMTWQLKLESERVHLVRGTEKGRPAWHYVLLVDDEETIEKFKETVKSGKLDVADYGQVLFSGWGEDPPNDITEKIHKKYNVKL